MTSSTLLNYSDDNTVVYSHANLSHLTSTLSHDSNIAVTWFRNNGMQANPTKFQCIISHKSHRVYSPLYIDSAALVPEETVKLLGVTFDVKLTFEQHVNDICKKASRDLNILKRFSKILSTANKTRIFHSFIVSHFNYCPVIWHFCSKRKTKMLDKIQERSLRFVFNDKLSSYDDLLKRIKKDPLHVTRLKSILILVYKCINNLCPTYVNSLFTIKVSVYTMRDNLLTQQPKMNTVFHGLNSLLYHGSKMWNSLPVYIKNATSLQRFKSLIKKYKKPLCTCHHCTHV